MEIKKGQTIYFKPERGELEEGEITKVGRKYFYAKFGSWREGAFYIENLREKTYLGLGERVYESEKEYWDGVKREKLFSLIREGFGYLGRSTYTLQQLEKVAGILEIEVE